MSGSGGLKNGVWVILYGDTVTFDGSSSSSDPDSVYNNVSDLVDADYEWDNSYDGTFTDSPDTGASIGGQLTEGSLPSGITEGQVQTMALRIADPDDSAVTDTATVDFRVNAPPEASFSHDPKDQYQGDTTTYDALVGETITFDASGSSDSDGTVETYSWDFGDGSTNDVSGNGINHSYSTAGEYTVELTVTDNDGDLSTAVTATVHIANEGDVDVTVE
jgi:PKD repeat protein